MLTTFCKKRVRSILLTIIVIARILLSKVIPIPLTREISLPITVASVVEVSWTPSTILFIDTVQLRAVYEPIAAVIVKAISVK